LVIQSRAVREPGRAIAITNGITFSLFLIISAVIGALIIARHPRNTIGWLLMFYPLATGWSSPLDPFAATVRIPAELTPPVLWLHWLSEWSWWLLIGPILLIPLLFPSGALLSRRWRWVIVSLTACFVTFLAIAAFEPTLAFGDASLPNPVGLIPVGLYDVLLIVFQAVLIVTAVFCVLAIFLRYRRASADEREQIKWLLYACGIFLVFYVISFFTQSFGDQLWGIIFNITVTGIPLAIGAAILRYHLWDIDLIINRTLVYVSLTAILGGLYSATITLSQKFLVATTGQKSDAALVMTTFVLVAAFTPIKNGLQQLVDKRFKESKNSLKEINTLDNQVRSVMEVLDAHQITRRLLTSALNAFQASGGAIYVDHLGGPMALMHATPGWREEDQKVSLPLEWDGRRFGMLCLGPRANRVEYNPQELEVLQQTANRVAWAIAGSSTPISE
jgi:hypothetical protein